MPSSPAQFMPNFPWKLRRLLLSPTMSGSQSLLPLPSNVHLRRQPCFGKRSAQAPQVNNALLSHKLSGHHPTYGSCAPNVTEPHPVTTWQQCESHLDLISRPHFLPCSRPLIVSYGLIYTNRLCNGVAASCRNSLKPTILSDQQISMQNPTFLQALQPLSLQVSLLFRHRSPCSLAVVKRHYHHSSDLRILSILQQALNHLIIHPKGC